MAVKFLVAHTVGALYNSGDVAGFEKRIEADLIKRGIAIDPKAKKAAPDKPVPKKVGETWSVFAGSDELVKGLADEAAAAAWISEQAKA